MTFTELLIDAKVNAASQQQIIEMYKPMRERGKSCVKVNRQLRDRRN